VRQQHLEKHVPAVGAEARVEEGGFVRRQGGAEGGLAGEVADCGGEGWGCGGGWF
jgi:hypothetical protein